MCQHDQTYRIDNEANGGQGCPRCNRRVVLVQHADGAREVDPAFGPQDAPQDYRIANRPGNPNWRGVKAWFDEAAHQLTDAEIADMEARCEETEAEPPTNDGMWK